MRAKLDQHDEDIAERLLTVMNQTPDVMFKYINDYLADRSFFLLHKNLFCYLFNELIENRYFIPGDMGLIIQVDRQTFIPVAEGFTELEPIDPSDPVTLQGLPFIGMLLSRLEEGATIELLYQP